MITTPLRYPGGKAKAIKKILPLVPEFSEFREPFLGGGSVFIAVKQKFPNKKYWINDLNVDLYHFWLNLKDSCKEMISGIQKIKKQETDGRVLHKKLVEKNPKSSIEKAVRFFVLNRITFSGTIEAGGYSQGAFEARFTQSSIDRVKATEPILENTLVTNLDYEELIKKPGKDVFIFLDPPYLSATKSRLYGKNGNLHTTFDHERFAEVMKKTNHKWMITYDDCPEVRKLFSFANIISWEFQYGMNNYKQETAAKGKELIITNYDVSKVDIPGLMVEINQIQPLNV
ncbi:MAG: DNA adenine methylase [Chitinophagaceae bacterium]|jgi:DNA adenine methylase|nr:DNA adenine methylase [Chitinophagaceae bacterium]